MCQNYGYAIRPEVSNPSRSVVSGWTKNTHKKTIFLKNKKNHLKRKNSKTSSDTPLNQRSNPLGSVVYTMFCKVKSAKNQLFLRGDFRPLPNKSV